MSDTSVLRSIQRLCSQSSKMIDHFGDLESENSKVILSQFGRFHGRVLEYVPGFPWSRKFACS